MRKITWKDGGMRDPASLKPHPKNPRLHSEEQVDQLGRLYDRYGWTQPMLILPDGTIVAGHGRQLMAIKKGIPEVPTRVGHGMSESEAVALIIADNRMTELGEWDADLLRGNLEALEVDGFDLDLTGFDLGDFGDEEEEPGGTVEERELTPKERERLNRAWRLLISEWRMAILGQTHLMGIPTISPTWSKGSLAVAFVRSMLYGTDIPRNATLPYTPHRLTVSADKAPIVDALAKAKTSTAILNSLIWACRGMPSFERFMSSVASFPIHGHRAPADFPALLARDLIDAHCPKGGAVLDPCHGWGGRMLGFLLSRAESYRGFEVDEGARDGVATMFADLRSYCPAKKTAKLELCAFEASKLSPESFDFAITSPPYYDVEKYDGDLQSWRLYKYFEDWIEFFFRPLIVKTHAALKPGAVFALQVGNQSYPLEDKAIGIGEAIGFSHVETRATGMSNNQAQTAPEDGEVIVILKKKAARKSRAA